MRLEESPGHPGGASPRADGIRSLNGMGDEFPSIRALDDDRGYFFVTKAEWILLAKIGHIELPYERRW